MSLVVTIVSIVLLAVILIVLVPSVGYVATLVSEPEGLTPEIILLIQCRLSGNWYEKLYNNNFLEQLTFW